MSQNNGLDAGKRQEPQTEKNNLRSSALVRVLSFDALILIALLIVATFFRLYRLDAIPPGMNNDEGYNLIDLVNVLRGQFSIFFSANQGREPLYFYLNTVSVALFGETAFALRLTSAFIGIATIGIVFGCARDLFRSTGVGALAALFAAISVWHIFYSRYGLRVILSVPLTTLTLWFFWRGLHNFRWRDFAMAGVCASLAVYTYLSPRLLPIALVVIAAYAAWSDRKNWRAYVRGLAITGIVALIIFLPLGIHFVTHLDDFAAHSAYISIFDANVNKGDLPGALWRHTLATAQMFFIQGDAQVYRNVANRPVFDPFVAGLFVVGVLALLTALVTRRTPRETRLRAVLIASWLAVFLLVTIFSDDVPAFIRPLPAMPAVMMIPAWGAFAIWERLRQPILRRASIVVLGVIVVASTTLAYRDYFISFGESSATYYAFDGHIADTATWIVKNSATTQAYIAPLWARFGTMQIITRVAPPKAYETRDSLVLPSNTSGKDAVMIFPTEQAKKAATFGERLGALATREEIIGSIGQTVAIAYRVPAKNLPDARDPLAALSRGSAYVQAKTRANANWENQIALLGYTLEADGPGERNLAVTLFLNALAPMSEDYSFSIKVRDTRERVWAQEDKWLGNNSYATTQMSAGDVVVEKFFVGLNPCAPTGDYRLTVEAYNPRTMQTLGEPIALGTTRAGKSQGNLYEHLEPDQKLDATVAPNARLLGFTLTPDEIKSGESFSLSLFWRGAGDGKQSHRAIIRLRDATQRDFVLADKTITIPIEGRGLCTLLDLQLGNAAPGQAIVLVNDTKVADVKIK